MFLSGAAAIVASAEIFPSPAEAIYWGIHGSTLFTIVPLTGLVCFAYIIARRMVPLVRGQSDVRFDRPFVRLGRVFQFWFGQWRHPRYRGAGLMHILIFAGFILL